MGLWSSLEKIKPSNASPLSRYQRFQILIDQTISHSPLATRQSVDGNIYCCDNWWYGHGIQLYQKKDSGAVKIEGILFCTVVLFSCFCIYWSWMTFNGLNLSLLCLFSQTRDSSCTGSEMETRSYIYLVQNILQQMGDLETTGFCRLSFMVFVDCSGIRKNFNKIAIKQMMIQLISDTPKWCYNQLQPAES